MSGIVSPIARRLIDEEFGRRTETRLAILAVVKFVDDPAAFFGLGDLRAHVEKFYGRDIARAATAADLNAGAACAGAIIVKDGIAFARLAKPSREEMKRIAAKWNTDLPPPELPLIRRPLLRNNGSERHEADPENHGLAPGTLYAAHGMWRQVPDPATVGAWRTGGKKNTARRRRMPGYVANLRAFLDREAVTPFSKNEAMISAVDRQILEYIIEGKTIRWIADEMGMKRPTVHRRVKGLRDDAGIAGPGSGR